MIQWPYFMYGIFSRLHAITTAMRKVSDTVLLTLLYVFGIGASSVTGRIMHKQYLDLDGTGGTWKPYSGTPASDRMY